MELTLDHLVAYCITHRVNFEADADGSLWLGGKRLALADVKRAVGGDAKTAAAEMDAPAFTAPDFLRKAAGHMQQRASTYDKPEGERSMAQTVEVFNAYHRTRLTETQGWHFMQILKDVRLFARASFHADSAEDGVAYSALKAEARRNEMANNSAPRGVLVPTPCCAGGTQTAARCSGCAEAASLQAEALRPANDNTRRCVGCTGNCPNAATANRA